MILPESPLFCWNKYLFQRDWVSARSYPHHNQKLLTDPASAGQLFFLSEYELPTKIPWSAKEGPFVMNSQNNRPIHQKALSSSVINSSIAVLFLLYLIFISLLSSASTDSQGREIYKEAVASCISSPLSALANPLISKLLCCNQSNIFSLALGLQRNH